MSFTIDAKELQRFLVLARPLYGRNSKWIAPVLGCVNLEFNAYHVKLQATDLDISVSYAIDATPTSSDDYGFSLAVPGRTFGEILRGAKGPVVLIASAGDPQLTIVANSNSHMLKGIVGEFPLFPSVSEDCMAVSEWDMAQFRDELKRVSVFASSDSGRPIYTGIAYNQARGAAVMAGTDGHVLGIRRFADPDATLELDVILPGRLWKFIPREIRAGVDATVGLTSDRGWLCGGGYTIAFRNIEGKYPNFERLIPDEIKFAFSADRDAIAQAIAQVAPMAADTVRTLTVGRTDSGEVALHAETQDLGSADASVSADSVADFQVFHAGVDTLGRAVAQCAPGRVEISQNAPMDPIHVYSADGFRALVMPIRVPAR